MRNIEEPSVKVCYKTFSEFCQRLSGLKGISNWNFRTFPDKVVLQLMEEPYLLPKFEIAVDDSLGFTVKVYGCFLPEYHLIYLDFRRTVRNVTISRLAKDLEDNYSLCCGVDEHVLEITGKLSPLLTMALVMVHCKCDIPPGESPLLPRRVSRPDFTRNIQCE